MHLSTPSRRCAQRVKSHELPLIQALCGSLKPFQQANSSNLLPGARWGTPGSVSPASTAGRVLMILICTQVQSEIGTVVL